jgi:6-phosphogluconolactonase (cycloisomerase 2 family)
MPKDDNDRKYFLMKSKALPFSRNLTTDSLALDFLRSVVLHFATTIRSRASRTCAILLFPLLLFSSLPAFGAGSTGSVVISGTAAVGQTLTAGNTLADADGLGTITYQWFRDGFPVRSMLKNGYGSALDGLDGAWNVILSADGKHAYVTGDLDDAVSWFEMNATTGALTYGGRLKDGLNGVDGLDGANGLSISADGKHLYVAGVTDHAVSWYERNATTGALTYGGLLKDGENGVNVLEGASHVAVSPDGLHAYVTAGVDNAVSWYSRNASTGALTYRGKREEGSGGIDALEGANWVMVSSDGLHVYVTGGSGEDAVSWYSRNAGTGALTYGGVLKDGENGLDGLAGARQITLSPDGNYAYVMAEWDNAVSWFSRNAGTGALTFVGMLQDGVGGVDGLNRASGLALAADGNQVLVSGNNEDSISWFDRNASTGALTYRGILQNGVNGVVGMDGAMSVALSADGNHVIVTGNNDDAVSWIDRNATTGTLTYGGTLKDNANSVSGLDGANGITLSADGKHFYVTGNSDNAVSWYERNASTGALSYGGMLKDGVGGVDGLNGARGITMSSDGNHAYVTGNSDNAVSWYERNASTGALIYGGMLQDGVNGADGLDAAWDIMLSADGKHAYVTGGGDDAVSWHERNASTGALTYGGVLKDGVGGVDGLDGAWNVTLSTDGKHAYVTGSLDDAVGWYERNASTGALTYGGVLKDGVGGVDGLDYARDVTLSVDGKHIYVTGNSDDAVSWYERNASTGALTYGGMLKDGVNGVDGLNGAQGITMSPDGKHAYVTGSLDDAVGWYERNASTGALTYVGMLKDGENGVDGLDAARGVTLSADGNHAYVTGSNDDAVSWYERNASTGALTFFDANESTYVLTSLDVGSVISVVASYTDGATNPEQVHSAATQTVNTFPAFSSPSSSGVVENQTFALDVNATDADGDALTYSIAGGVDQAKFDLNSSTGVLTFKNAPDFEANGSAGSDNSYLVVVRVSDGTADINQTVTVSVTNVNEVPSGVVSIAGTPQVGQTLTLSNTLADPDGLEAITYQWYRDGQPIMLGGTLKDGVDGVDGLAGNSRVSLSADGKYIYLNGQADDSVSWYERNATTGALSFGGLLRDGVGGVDGLDATREVRLSHDGKHAYATGYEDAAVSWYERNASTGALSFGGLLRDGVGGVDGLGGARDVRISADGLYAYLTGNVDDSISWFERNASTGALSYGGTLKDGENGVDGLDVAREIALSLDGKHVYVTAYGDHAVSWYERNASNGALVYGGVLKDGVGGVDGLGGALGVILSADGKHAYVTGSADDSISWFERNASTGVLSFAGVLKDGVNGVDGLDDAYGMTLSADGKHAYAAGREDDALSWFERNASTGALSFAGVLKDGENGVDGLHKANDVVVSADGKYLYVSTGLSSADHSLSWFERNASTGALSYAASGSNYTLTVGDAGSVITVQASYTDGGTFPENVSSSATAQVNTLSAFASSSTVSVPENQTLALDVNATDADGDSLTYSIAGGADQAKFDLNSSTGVLTFKVAPDFEANGSAAGSNAYQVTVQVTDGTSPVTQSVTVTVTDQNDAPFFTTSASGSVLENQTFALDVNATDADGDSLTYSIAGGADQAKFDLNSSTGVLTFKNAPDFEANGSAAGNNAYQVTVQVTDGTSPVTQSVTITVTDQNEVPVFTTSGSISVLENQTFALALNATDPDGENLTYSIAGGVDQAKFDLNSSTGVLTFKNAPDFEANGSAAGNNAYQVTVQVTDGTFPVTQSVTVTVTDQNEVPSNLAPSFVSASSADSPENQSVAIDLNATDPDGDILTFSITGGADGSLFDLNASTGVLSFKSPPDFENPGDADANNTYELTVQVSDGSLIATQALQIRVADLFRPIADTGLTESLTANSATLKGEVIDDGGMAVTDRGFLLSLKPGPEPGKAGVVTLTTAWVPVAFSADATALLAGKKYFYRAFATNGEGTGYGTEESFTTIAEGASPHWIDAQPGASKDWWTSPWFGGFQLLFNGWVKHVELGMVFPMESSTTGLWLWKEGFGWLWTDKEVYPYLYKNTGGGWIHFSGQHEGTGLLYDHAKEEWRTLDQEASSLPEESNPDWIDAQPSVVKDWWTSAWFGSFYLSSNGWVMHEELGMVFPKQSLTTGLWLWKEGYGWLWTDKGVYPFIYDNTGSGWLYFTAQDQGIGLLYDYQLKKWKTLEGETKK